MSDLETQVLIIGGGATGTGLARDLALRGVQCILVEKEDINAGASGGNHGLLHSGARYVSNDPISAEECRLEANLLRQLAPQCIEDTGGLFVAVEGDDENYIADFPLLCSKCGIPIQEISRDEAFEREPGISKKLIAAYLTEDGAIDPFKLSLENLAQAQSLGCTFLQHVKVIGFEMGKNRVEAVHVLNTESGQQRLIKIDQVVNASGVWAAEIAALANIPINNMLYSKGSLLVTAHRLSHRVINRLRPPSDGDILVPGGTVSILGTTSVRVHSLDNVRPTVPEVDLIVDELAEVVPGLQEARYVRAYSGVRPLTQTQKTGDDRAVSRGFTVFDHAHDGLENFTTITGGKLTTYRLMAEKAADLVCKKLGISSPCLTLTEPFPSAKKGKWTEPGLSPRVWLKEHAPRKPILCECEMIPEDVIDDIVETIRNENGTSSFKAVAARSRMGKGLCQGTVCGMRVTSHLYEQGILHRDQGLVNIKEFLGERWKGERPVLWGEQLIQAGFKEALYCGLLDLEL